MQKKVQTIGSIVIYMIAAAALFGGLYSLELFPAGESVWHYFYIAENLLNLWTAEVVEKQTLFLCYAVFAGVLYFLSAVIWYDIGKKEKKEKMGFLIGLFWFFMPVNMQIFFREGELSISLFLSILPLLIWQVYCYLEKGKRNAAINCSVLSFVLILCNTGYAVLVFVVLVNYLFFTGLLRGVWKEAVQLIPAFLIPFLFHGIWLLPYVKQFGIDTWQYLQSHIPQKFISSLYPMTAFGKEGGNWYFGLAVFLLLLLGAVFSYRKTMPLFWSALLILIDSSLLFSPLIGVLPIFKNMNIPFLFPVAVCLILMGFLFWDTLKKQFLVLFMILMIADAAVFFCEVLKEAEFGTKQTMEQLLKDTLFEEAYQLTTQKLIIFSGERERELADFVFAGGEKEISLLKDTDEKLAKALTERKYLYVFDRCLEQGSDTIVVEKSMLSKWETDIDNVTNAAKQLGYVLKTENQEWLLYHLEGVKEPFFVESRYDAIGIGTSARLLSQQYPTIQETKERNLNAYSYEQLSQYKTVYLNGFTYEDKQAAEQLILRLSKNGTRVVIEGSGIPADILSKNKEFLGVTCSEIAFENGFPILYLTNQKLDLNLFAGGYEQWQTVYLVGLNETLGYFYGNQIEIQFLGTIENENLIFVGLDLGYHYVLTDDPNAGELYEELLNLTKNQLPERKLAAEKSGNTADEEDTMWDASLVAGGILVWFSGFAFAVPYYVWLRKQNALESA